MQDSNINFEKEIEILFKNANNLKQSNEIKNAIEDYQKILQLAKKEKIHNQTIIETHYQIAQLYQLEKNIEQTIKYLENFESFINEFENNDIKESFYIQIIKIYLEKNDLTNQLKYQLNYLKFIKD